MGKTKKIKHKWTFRPRFRRHCFGWRSQPAIKRINEAVNEISKVARKDPVLGAEGAVLFLEKVSPAIEQIDSSSGAIGNAVNRAIAKLAVVIGKAPADDILREKWMDRLWQAIEDDGMPYLESLADHWGEMCATELHASRWADEFIDTVRTLWSPDNSRGGWFKGTHACMSALFQAGRYDELFELIELDPHDWWSSRIWGARALAAQGKPAQAIQYAEATSGWDTNPASIARTCEEILLAAGEVEQAYSQYSFLANDRNTYLATFRAIAAKYPDRDRGEILRDLVARTPGAEGKWFAAARSIGLYDEAIELANRNPCDPKTLTRAARDMKEKNPAFALEAGMAALRWFLAGYGYEISALDVHCAYGYTMEAAAEGGCVPAAKARIAQLLEDASSRDKFCGPIIRGLMNSRY